jgi:phospholipid/cholesterol/gamma-HCH transport system substrate-binding protein
MNSNKKYLIEASVGLFMVLGFACFMFVAMRFGSQSIFSQEGYILTAKFQSISGLKKGSLVEIAGVKIGKVSNITLDGYRAKVEMNINDGIKIDDEAMASIRTKGIIGEKYIKLTVGASDDFLGAGDEIEETESVLDIEEMIGKFIYGK